eukprot:TRINITY_DN3093_c0_g1_i1.p1 TRINITY_DN3093_c0_g1~~TRINITY_DN3093_c0_g1_i1.p1  ORF type:complete len:138 (+),score=22.88 TRINITY_DN3093_c0_g1_i1:71-484(+)
MIAALAVIGKTNNPLYIKVVGKTDTELRFHYIVHTALDVIEETVNRTKEAAHTEKYLGLLYPTEEFKVYGYLTNTQIKFVLVLDYDSKAKDAEVKNFFSRFHEIYADTVCNPFYTADENITSKKFEERVNDLISQGF